MLAQRQLAVAAVRAEVKRHEVAKQALSRLRKLAEKVGDPELRDSIQASLNSIRGCTGRRQEWEVITHPSIPDRFIPGAGEDRE